MKFSGKMGLKILKVTKKQGFSLCLEDTLFEKTRGGGGSTATPTPTSSCFRGNMLSISSEHRIRLFLLIPDLKTNIVWLHFKEFLRILFLS